MENQAILNSIIKSKWYSVSDYLIQFYHYPELEYGLYLPGLERFMLVDYVDLWSMVYASKLLSSKFHSLVMPLDYDLDIHLNTCLRFTAKYDGGFPYEAQPPLLKDKVTKEKLIEVGLPSDQDLERVVKDQEFCLCVLRYAQALKVIDAMYSNIDHRFYRGLFPPHSSQYLKQAEDETLVPTGFIPAIEKILYHATTTDEIEQNINKIFEENTLKPYFMAKYKEKFYKLLDYDKR